MLRRLAVPAALLVPLAAAPAARADSVLNGGTIGIELRLPDGDGGFEVVAEQTEDNRLQRHFNLARCQCSSLGVVDDTTQLQLRFSWAQQPTFEPSSNQLVQVWFGSGCDTEDVTLRASNCGGAVDTFSADALSQAPVEKVFVVDQVINPTMGADCPATEDRRAYAFTDDGGDNVFDDKFNLSVPVDTIPPPGPAGFTDASGSEEAVRLSWDAPEGDDEDVFYWQALCARVDGDGFAPAFDTPPVEPRYETAGDLCNAPVQQAVTVLPVAGQDDAEPLEPPAELLTFDPAYLCGETGPTSTTLTLQGLQNGQTYAVVLLSVDRAGNVKGVRPAGGLTPRPATDFWEDLHDQGSEAEGGFCLVADTYGDRGGPGGALTEALRRFRDDTLAASAPGRWLTAAYYDHVAPLGELARGSVAARLAFAAALLPAVALALAWHALTLPGLLAVALGLGLLARRRRAARPARQRSPRAARRRVALATAACLAAPGVAAAQSFAPYWDDPAVTDEAAGTRPVQWHAGLKLGPYLPAIDAQLDGATPYADMFRGGKIMGLFDLDRVIWRPAVGQLAVGGSVGFFGDKATAYLGEGGTTGDPARPRATGDKTAIRIVPMMATAAFRLTVLDDRWGVPVVPYVRGGLGYYAWWITAPDGDAAVDYGDCDPAVAACDGDTARGASLGLVASAGLAIRAERIDRTAQASMQGSGLRHAGFYGELSLGWVDGFGSARKLAVGDTTWFAGIDFEF